MQAGFDAGFGFRRGRFFSAPARISRVRTMSARSRMWMGLQEIGENCRTWFGRGFPRSAPLASTSDNRPSQKSPGQNRRQQQGRLPWLSTLFSGGFPIWAPASEHRLESPPALAAINDAAAVRPAGPCSRPRRSKSFASAPLASSSLNLVRRQAAGPPSLCPCRPVFAARAGRECRSA